MATTAIEMAKKNNLNLIDPNNDDILGIDGIAKEYGLVQATGANPFSEGLKMANGIALLRTSLNDNLMKAIMSLQGTSLGFKTDKDKEGGYPMPVVRDAVIEALMRGVHIAGNEFNIIASKCYITKEGFGTLLAKIPGLRYSMTPGIPKMVQGGAEESVKVEWVLNGEKNCETLNFAIRVNAGMGSDAVCGKAVRKSRCWLYNRITGFDLADSDLDDVEGNAGTASTVANSRFAGGSKAKKAQPSPAPQTVKVEEAEVINVEEAPAETTATPDAEPTPEEQYPRLAEMLKQRNAPLSVADIVAWHTAFKMAVNEDSVLANFDKAVSDCLTWRDGGQQ